MYLYKAAFISLEELYLTMGHEFLHVMYTASGLTNVNQAHASIFQWEMEQSAAWNYKATMYKNHYSLHIHIDMRNTPINSDYHYSEFGYTIFNCFPVGL